jgi:hypothetical protein
LGATGNATLPTLVGATQFAADSLTNLTVSGGTSAVTLQVNSSSGGNLNINTKNGNPTIFNNQVQALTFKAAGNTLTLSGSTVPTFYGNFGANLAGTSTVSGNTSLAFLNVGSATDNASVANGSFNAIEVGGNYGGAIFDGGRVGLFVAMNWNTASTVSKSSAGLVGYGSKVTSSVNAGGVSAGFGTTQFGLGSIFGANPWCDLKSGATFYTQCVGEEVDSAIQTGASAANLSVMQLVLTSDHAVHGTIVDEMLELAAQVGASVGVRNLITAGRYDAQWPLDPNGYLFQVQGSGPVATAAAGGFDMNQLVASGTGPEGGGFFWRSPGVQLIDTGVQVGYGLLNTNANGVVLDAPYSEMATAAGSITVGAGGSNFTSGDMACDAYGDCVVVAATAGVVTGVSAVVTRGWQKTPPSNPVSFTARTRTGASLGTGLTLNLGSWTAKTQITIGGSGGPIVLASLPTSCTGKPTGTVWNNSNVLNVCP